jgi:hypothetical protein
MRGLVEVPLLALSFLLGLIVALLVTLLVSQRRTARGREPALHGAAGYSGTVNG